MGGRVLDLVLNEEELCRLRAVWIAATGEMPDQKKQEACHHGKAAGDDAAPAQRPQRREDLSEDREVDERSHAEGEDARASAK